MGRVTETKAVLLWSDRIGGGYPTIEQARIAAEFLEFDVMIGAPHPIHGFFMVPHPAPKRDAIGSLS